MEGKVGLSESLFQQGAEKTVPVSVLEELHRQMGDLKEQFNGLGYKRLGGLAASLADMNIFVKEQIREAREQPNGARIAAGAPTMSEKVLCDAVDCRQELAFLRVHLKDAFQAVATQIPTASALTHDVSSQTSPLEPSRDIAADSPPSDSIPPAFVAELAIVSSQNSDTKGGKFLSSCARTDGYLHSRYVRMPQPRRSIPVIRVTFMICPQLTAKFFLRRFCPSRRS